MKRYRDDEIEEGGFVFDEGEFEWDEREKNLNLRMCSTEEIQIWYAFKKMECAKMKKEMFERKKRTHHEKNVQGIDREIEQIKSNEKKKEWKVRNESVRMKWGAQIGVCVCATSYVAASW